MRNCKSIVAMCYFITSSCIVTYVGTACIVRKDDVSFTRCKVNGKQEEVQFPCKILGPLFTWFTCFDKSIIILASSPGSPSSACKSHTNNVVLRGREPGDEAIILSGSFFQGLTYCMPIYALPVFIEIFKFIGAMLSEFCVSKEAAAEEDEE